MRERIGALGLAAALAAVGATTARVAILRGNPAPPTSWKVVHVPTITVGLDIVLEKRRGRRY